MGKELVSLVAGKELEGGDNIKLCWKGPASKVYTYRVVKEEANGFLCQSLRGNRREDKLRIQTLSAPSPKLCYYVRQLHHPPPLFLTKPLYWTI